MSDIKFTCPLCSKSIAVDEKYAGLAIACPECQEKIMCKKIINPKMPKHNSFIPKIIMSPLLKGCFVAIGILLLWAVIASLVAFSRGTEIVILSTGLASVTPRIDRIKKESENVRKQADDELAKARQEVASLKDELTKARQKAASIEKEAGDVHKMNDVELTKVRQEVTSIKQEFCKVVQDAAESYKSTANELQRSKLRSNRREGLKTFASKYGEQMEDWTGTINRMTTTGNGDAILSVASTACGQKIELRTGNTSLFDIGNQTIIKQYSPMFNVLAALPEGTPIKFSGRLFADERDGFREMSVTERGSMTEPEFLFLFTSIQKQ